ncbi:hypothetical protein RY831_04810 [Noviherbaspirillum sp. CPCC 100848]|uniref:Uncharacterized protein n=1 Tax=Noviherbaspirillum album TaxID=3080276 RepID=A0ABU6J4K7_9BURK|nr:hypothetical protein [Noviherbaspirillum sp. CPCC 100848]MEC4718455.1 hypothetical protein [Noviherbaspirillum sp. CPCC 100848]
MEYIDEIKGPLNAMLLPVRWKGLRRNEISRVMTSLVHAWLYKYPPQWYLKKIIDIIALQENLEVYLQERFENETDHNIRQFLLDLALEIERQYPNVARSGRCVKTAGHWVSNEVSQNPIEIDAGQSLPFVNGREVVWELQEHLPETPEDALLTEFQKFYHQKTLKGNIRYENTLELAHYSVTRFNKNYSEHFRAEIAELLRVMAIDNAHSMHRNIETTTEHDFTNDERKWEWYCRLLNDISSGLKSIAYQYH